MSSQLINQYYNQLHALKRAGVSNEMAIKQPFDMLLLQMATPKHYVYATEVTIKNEKGKNIRPDGVLMNELRIHKGYVESKDTNDTLNNEIDKKLNRDGYPKTNILFQDSIEAVLIQNGEETMRVDMQEANRLEAIIKAFIDYKPEYIKKFDEALEKFKADIPVIVKTLRDLIEEQNKTNKNYAAARNAFWDMCKQEINPEITVDDIREMVIQHILTEDLFKSVFDESDFHQENNIARELEKLVNTFMSRTVRQNQLNELGHYYRTLNAQASAVADHHEKQKFLKVVYENFYKVYNPKGADRLGVVYTPNEIVDFMIRSTDYLLEKHFGRNLHDENVHILDPATGTGTFITDIIEYIPAQYLKYKYENEIHANEVAILPYYVANLNIEFTYKQKMGAYAEFPNICFVDTLDNTAALAYEGKQHSLFGFSSENAERISRQNKQKISVIIGNPPYNAKQENYNYQNSNRAYKPVDKRIKETYIKHGTAQNQNVVYDMYTRFYRWASDRLNENGIIAMISNNSYVGARAFDGFRKCIQDEFDYAYIVDLGGNIRELSGKDGIFLGEAHTVFGLGAMVGISIMFLVKHKERKHEECQIRYIHPCDIRATRIEKFEWITSIKNFSEIKFNTITPSKKNDWINHADNDFEDLIPLIDKDVKAGKSDRAIFNLFSRGLETARDEWVFDNTEKTLVEKIKFLVKVYNKSIQLGKMDLSIKWSSSLELYYRSKRKTEFNPSLIISSLYRPFLHKIHYSDFIFNHRLTQNHYDIFGKKLSNKNKLISFSGIGSSRNFQVLASDILIGLDTLEKTQCIPLFKFNNKEQKSDNITDWGLTQVQNHYSNEKITKEDIFHYTYGVLHNPAYRKKYELNLKRDFPRLPFYKDFFQWAAWGKQLMDLHIDYENAPLFDLKRTDTELKTTGKLKVKLKAFKQEGIIELDEQTSLHGVPPQAWEYKLGNRSAIEWVLDQYKEKTPKDKTIAEKFNTYRFADYKEQVVELLKKVTTVSVETMKVIGEMEKVGG